MSLQHEQKNDELSQADYDEVDGYLRARRIARRIAQQKEEESEEWQQTFKEVEAMAERRARQALGLYSDNESEEESEEWKQTYKEVEAMAERRVREVLGLDSDRTYQSESSESSVSESSEEEVVPVPSRRRWENAMRRAANKK